MEDSSSSYYVLRNNSAYFQQTSPAALTCTLRLDGRKVRAEVQTRIGNIKKKRKKVSILIGPHMSLDTGGSALRFCFSNFKSVVFLTPSGPDRLSRISLTFLNVVVGC